MQGFSFVEVKNQYKWPIKFDIPVGVDKKGNPEFATQHMICLFKMLPKSEVQEILQGDFSDEEADKSLVNTIFAGWPDGQVKDEYGKELPDNAENIKRFLDLPFVHKPIVMAYFASLGGQKAQRKN